VFHRMRQSSIGLRPLPPYHLPPLLQEVKYPSLIHRHPHSFTYSFTHTHSFTHSMVYERQNLSLCFCDSQPGRKKISIGLRHCLPVAHHLQLLSSTIGGNQRHALNALYRPIEMHLIQRRPTSSKMADQILLKRKTMNC
jgi:hypothetical protein